MENYTVLVSLDHDRKLYNPGETVKLAKSDAEPLLDLGVIQLAPKASTTKAATKATEPPAEAKE